MNVNAFTMSTHILCNSVFTGDAVRICDFIGRKTEGDTWDPWLIFAIFIAM